MAFVFEMNEHAIENKLSDRKYWNSDQSRFEYELKRDRTYEEKGIKIVEAMACKLNALSHSYTIQIHMSKDGCLGEKMFIVFQEASGNFGVRVQKLVDIELKTCTNVIATATKSGKCTKEMVKIWYTEVFADDIEEDTVLLLDAWTGQSDKIDYAYFLENKDDTGEPTTANEEKNVEIKYLPKSSTQYIQPLDLYFFRQYKVLIKDITHFVRLRFVKWALMNPDELDLEESENESENLPENRKESSLKKMKSNNQASEKAPERPDNRYFIIRLHSICYNQMRHPIFYPMWRYAWQKGGYETSEPFQTFSNVRKALRAPAHRVLCNCGTPSFMKCLYCGQIKCIDCWFFKDEVHLHSIEDLNVNNIGNHVNMEDMEYLENTVNMEDTEYMEN